MPEKTPETKRIAVVRIRGRTGIPGEIADTLRMLNITRVNHCSVVKSTPSSKGMMHKVKDYITWGELDRETFQRLLKKWALLPGNKRIGEGTLKEKGFSSFDEFAEKFFSLQAELSDIGVKPVFRLHPPRKGYRHVKRQYPQGALGYRGEKINELLRRMS